jgi:hypothetical protein
MAMFLIMFSILLKKSYQELTTDSKAESHAFTGVFKSQLFIERPAGGCCVQADFRHTPVSGFSDQHGNHPAGDPFPAPGGVRVYVHQMCPPAGRMGDGGHHPEIAKGCAAGNLTVLDGQDSRLIPFQKIPPAGFHKVLTERVIIFKVIDSSEGFQTTLHQQADIVSRSDPVFHTQPPANVQIRLYLMNSSDVQREKTQDSRRLTGKRLFCNNISKGDEGNE